MRDAGLDRLSWNFAAFAVEQWQFPARFVEATRKIAPLRFGGTREGRVTCASAAATAGMPIRSPLTLSQHDAHQLTMIKKPLPCGFL
jgi:hypothetical protein